MILYHFTDFYSLKNAGPEAILAAGLKARDSNKDYPMFAGKLRPCVWFTSEPELSKVFQTAGAQEARITVELSTLSKRLISWPKLLQKTIIYNETHTAYDVGLEKFERMERDKELRVDLGREPTQAELRAWRYWWIHFGDVPLKAIRTVENSDPQRRAQDSEEIAAAYHEAGHAVARAHVGAAITGAEIRKDGSGLSEGTGELWRSACNGQYATWDLLIVLLAGVFAETKATREPEAASASCAEDMAEAKKMIKWLVAQGFAVSEKAAWERAGEETLAFQRECWPAIERVANELRGRGRLEADEVRRLIG